jgi:hypothetical protein
MRSKLYGLLLGCSLVAAMTASALACDYRVNASTNDQTSTQQTAQTQQSTESR